MNNPSGNRPLLSIVVPAYNEAENLPLLHQRLAGVLEPLDVAWEWIIVDDNSSDETYTVAAALAAKDARIRVIRLARNHGSFPAIACGLRHASGDCATVLAADLQDPPEVIADLLTRWRAGTQVVWAVRNKRLGESLSTRLFSRAYCWMMRHIVQLKDMPPTGADFFLLDRRVVDAFCQFRERSVSIIPLIMWLGFKQECVQYDKQARAFGRSGWTLEKKLAYALDSVTSFSYLPIRLISYTGIAVACVGFLFAVYVAVEALMFGRPVAGYPSLMLAILMLGGMQMIMLGVLGEYLWRTFDEVRRRPRWLIEERINFNKGQWCDHTAPSTGKNDTINQQAELIACDNII